MIHPKFSRAISITTSRCSHRYRLFLWGLVLFIAAVFMGQQAFAGAKIVDAKLAERDFMRVMLSAEYGGANRLARSIKKYNNTVRFAVINHATKNRRPAVRHFVSDLRKKVKGLKVTFVSNKDRANFRIHVVDQAQYASVMRKHVLKNKNARVRGQCYVRAILGKNGIQATDVVIVSDRDEFTFNRCLVEEVLQGLGPLADKGHKAYSVFNTASQHSSFTLHDRVLMNALYDPRIRAGMSKAQVKKLISQIIRENVARLQPS